MNTVQWIFVVGVPALLFVCWASLLATHRRAWPLFVAALGVFIVAAVATGLLTATVEVPTTVPAVVVATPTEALRVVIVTPTPNPEWSLATATPEPAGNPGSESAGALASAASASAAGSDTWLTAEEVFKQAYRPCPAGVSCLNLEVAEIHKCVGEPNCWAATREKDLAGNIVPFAAVNFTTYFQDGWMNYKEDREKYGRKSPETARGSGILPGWEGLLQGFTFRRNGSPDIAAGSNVPLAANPTLSGVGGTSDVSDTTQLWVMGSGVNLREGPGTDQPVVGRLEYGQQVVGVRLSADWWELSNPKGWVYAPLVSRTKPAPQQQQQQQQAAVPVPTTSPGSSVAGLPFDPLKYVKLPAGVTLNWQSCESGRAVCWNTYQNADGKPVSMELACPQFGERVENDKGITGLKTGANNVAGITMWPCPS